MNSFPFIELVMVLGLLLGALAVNWLGHKAYKWASESIATVWVKFINSSAGSVIVGTAAKVIVSALSWIKYVLALSALLGVIGFVLYLLFPVITDAISFLKSGYWETTTILERLPIFPSRESLFGWVGLWNIIYWLLNLPSFLFGLVLGSYLMLRDYD